MKDTTNYLHFRKICAIIKQCGESGVKEINLKNGELDLRLVFSDKNIQGKDDPLLQLAGPPTAISPIIDNSLIKQDESRIKEFQLEELRITDPFQYENLIAQQELE